MTSIDLNAIHSPADIKGMDLPRLRALAAEMRSALIRKLSAHGGHVGPNLGMVEATISLHYVFDAPSDKIVFDVSHQTYPHKMLTGRMQAFTDPEHYNDVTGFTDPAESPEYDLFSVGHTSSSLAMASGIAKARDMRGGKENVVAVIGDGSLGGGEAFEGLNFGSTLGTNFIVMVNDNDMSIEENHGGMYADLSLLRNTNGQAEPNIFRSFGYSYRYVHYGNDLRSLIEMFRAIKDIDHPVVVHINTMKGCGLPVAEAEKERFHFSGPFDPKSGAPLHLAAAGTEAPTYDEIFADHMLDRIASGDRNLAILTAGTADAIGFPPDRRRQAGRQFIDVGIAEQMATGMTAGLAKEGVRPVFGVVSTFFQRAYDQISQDVAINGMPALFVLFHTGAFAMRDRTHLGFFDIAMISNIPGVNFLAPASLQEYKAMIDWAIDNPTGPVVVRTPGGKIFDDPAREILTDYSRPKYEIVRKGSQIALIGAGNMLYTMLRAADILADKGIKATVINPRCLSALDTDTLDTLRDYTMVITAEDGIADGGFGQKVAACLGEAPVKVKVLGLPKAFPDNYKVSDLLASCGLLPEQIATAAEEAVGK